MHVFLTSSPCNDDVPAGVNQPCIFFEKNDFVKNLRARMKPDARLVVVAGDPYNAPLNDGMADTFAKCFEYHGLTLSSVELLDARTEDDALRMVTESDVVLLGGGHVPTQNLFLDRIGMRALLWNYDGVVIGISAGSMNSASTVYAQPEMPGESVDPEYRKFLPGLRLTDVMILPHYQKVWNMMIDGRRLYEDVTYPDSVGRQFIAMPDGSYVLDDGEGPVLYGVGHLVSDGKFRTISASDGSTVPISGLYPPKKG